MLPIKIDISGFVQQAALSPGDVQTFTGMLLDRLEHDFKQEWEDEVVHTLHKTRPEYLRAMFSERLGSNTVVFGVSARESQLAVSLELGKDPFDEKIGFSKSPKRTTKADGSGWYLTIPFRYGTPGAVAESPAFAGVMPAVVYRLARKFGTVGLKQLPTALQQPGVRAAIRVGDKVIPKYTHKAAKFQGLTRKLDVRENRGKYFTFRRVSDKTITDNANAWWHPGWNAYNFLEKAINKVDFRGAIRATRIEFFTILNS